MFKTVELVPVSKWVYDLYKVTYSPSYGSGEKVKYLASSCENHLESDIENNWPSDYYETYQYEKVLDNVGHPRSIGHLYGLNMSESAISHGERIAKEKGFI